MVSPTTHLAPPPGAAPLPLDLALIRKYAVPGPRYTSYPPANLFHERLDSLDLDAAFAADNQSGAGPLSLYVHLPFCEARCWFCGCTTIITRRHDWAEAYVDDLGREFDITAPRMDCRRPVTQLHLGGGTPTFLSPAALLRLSAALRRHFTFAPEAEISVEIDPRTVTPGHVGALRALGVNRASLGIQDTDADVQRAIHRWQPSALNRRAVYWLREAGISSINLDLIYGLPRQTPQTIDRTLDEVLELAPERLSIFGYAHVPWIKPAQRILEQQQALPGPEARLEMAALLRRRLLAAGYVDIGLDHFARPNDELAQARERGGLHRNFQGYSTRAGASLYAFGISAISQTSDSYRQNVKTLEAYRTALAAGRLPIERGYRLTPEDHRRRRLIMGIMCDRRLDWNELEREFGFDPKREYAAEWRRLEEFAADGLIALDEAGLQVLPVGEPLLRVIAMTFDAYVGMPGPRRYSSAV